MSFLGRLFKHRLSQWLAFVLGLLLLLFFYSRDIEPNWIETRSLQLTLPHLPAEFSGYRLVQLSDIHVDPWMTQRRLQKIVDRVNQLKPDLVVLTGDFVTRNPQRFAPNLMALKNLHSNDRPLAVLGNHDAWTDPALIQTTLESAGVRVLMNQVFTLNRPSASLDPAGKAAARTLGDRLDGVALSRPSAQLHIAGVDDVWAERDRLDEVLAALPTTGSAILLAHEPDFADESAATGRFDLQLSGHSHGGQVHIPLLLRPLPPLAYKYPVGQYQVGAMIQYTNRGVGVSAIQARFNSRPEITVFTLKSS